jgi:hypothetical protein
MYRWNMGEIKKQITLRKLYINKITLRVPLLKFVTWSIMFKSQLWRWGILSSNRLTNLPQRAFLKIKPLCGEYHLCATNAEIQHTRSFTSRPYTPRHRAHAQGYQYGKNVFIKTLLFTKKKKDLSSHTTSSLPCTLLKQITL